MPLQLYQILDETKNEIRLVTIEPFQPTALVRCHLSTVPLNDFRPEYFSFIRAANFVGHSWDAARIFSYPSWRSAYGDRDETARALFGAKLGLHGANDGEIQLHNSALSSLPSTFHAASLLFTEWGWTWLANQGGYYYKWENWRLAHNNFLLGDQTLGSFFTDIIPDSADESAYIDVYCNVREMVMERRFMFTKRGYLGWAPDNADDEHETNHAKVGDLVAIVFGCSTPLIMRPRKERFQGFGEAYMQGFMNGEAFRLIEGGECEVQPFFFC